MLLRSTSLTILTVRNTSFKAWSRNGFKINKAVGGKKTAADLESVAHKHLVKDKRNQHVSPGRLPYCRRMIAELITLNSTSMFR